MAGGPGVTVTSHTMHSRKEEEDKAELKLLTRIFTFQDNKTSISQLLSYSRVLEYIL